MMQTDQAPRVVKPQSEGSRVGRAGGLLNTPLPQQRLWELSILGLYSVSVLSHTIPLIVTSREKELHQLEMVSQTCRDRIGEP